MARGDTSWRPLATFDESLEIAGVGPRSPRGDLWRSLAAFGDLPSGHYYTRHNPPREEPPVIVTDSFADISTPTGPMRTYFYAPQEPGRSPQPRAGLALYSEIFQQTQPVRRLAITFASLGYLVAVPEVYHAHEPPGCV